MEKVLLHNFPTVGFLSCKFTDDELAIVKKEIKKIRNNFSKSKKKAVNDTLAGQIEHEYSLEESVPQLSNLILPLVIEFEKKFKYSNILDKFNFKKGIELKQVWVNFQKKYEFNPYHDHGGIMSFVLWIQVPYLHEEENNTRTNLPTKGTFQFVYPNTTGGNSTFQLHVDKTYENTMILFPSTFIHQVYPFYSSNEYRISVSGNIRLTQLP